ncbi:MAG: hypothetical protein P4L84_32030, partial [Isosphaeraceae bacterium]|nr:hypothetical protein [Isosphaeraceae bacterium]
MNESGPASNETRKDRPPLPDWRFLFWYFLITLVMLWIWQEMLGRVVLRTIPYSEFKTRLAHKELTECTIRQDEIEGQVGSAAAQKAGVKTKAGAPAVETFPFRTVRVEDPQLVDELEKAGVKFTGERPGFLSHLVWAWLLPIGVMLVLWMVLSSRLGSAQESVLGFGKSRAKLVAETETRVNFDEVAGC